MVTLFINLMKIEFEKIIYFNTAVGFVQIQKNSTSSTLLYRNHVSETFSEKIHFFNFLLFLSSYAVPSNHTNYTAGVTYTVFNIPSLFLGF